jgi:FlaG/FlaF family flagellin (archaellin)
MKGISTILATILIVIIVVALVSLTYTFAISLFGASTKPVETGVSSTTQKIDKRVIFVVDPSCAKIGNDWQISFSIRHDGATYNITSSEISVYYGNDPTTFSWSPSGDMSPGSTKTITATNQTGASWGSTSRDVTVSAPANPISKSVTCP